MQPPLAWIGTRQVPRFLLHEGLRVANPAWRPFVTPVAKADFPAGAQADPRHFTPSQAAIKASFSVLSSFYTYLVREGRLAANPVVLIRHKSRFVRKEQLKPPIRRISTLQWDYALETAEQLADVNPAEHERTLFIMHCLFAMYLRISELVTDARSTPLMSHFRKDQDGHWWFYLTGKGNKQRAVTVCDAMLKALKRYRLALGLSPLPAPTELIPLIASRRGQGPVTSTRYIRRRVQACFDAAYRRMQADGLEADALELKTATVHWLHHTGISEDVKIRPREHVRDAAGHASMATTDHHVESDRRERHASGRKKHIKDF